MTNGVEPLAVQFTDQSTGTVTSWSWDFGDGGTSSLDNPSHEYTDAGDYTVSLTATGPGGSDTETKTDYIHVSEAPPVAAFTADMTNGNKPLTVQFTDQSMGTVTSWSWDFGDGGTSSLENPSYEYTDAGDYTVSLTATGPGGSDTETKTDYIHVSEALPVAAFIADVTNGVEPLAVQFTDQSTGSITGWSWTFGGGGTSTEQNPLHEYQAVGDYTVALTVTGPDGLDTEIKTDYVYVSGVVSVERIAVLNEKANGQQRLMILNAPGSARGETGAPIASDMTFGNANTLNNIAMAGVDIDGDGIDEVAVINEKADGRQRLMILNAPSTVGGETGPPIASDLTFGNASNLKNIAIAGMHH